MSERVEHYVNTLPFDPYRVETMTPEMERYYMASQWRIMWWKFRRHRLAVIAGAVLAVMYFSILICEFLAPYNLSSRHTDSIYAPPQRICAGNTRPIWITNSGCGFSASPTPTKCGACSKADCTWCAPPKGAPSSCWAPTASAATS
jgi:hypothetical protein